MIAAFDLPENKSKGVVSIDGRMVERLHADMARRTVAIAEAIAGRGRFSAAWLNLKRAKRVPSAVLTGGRCDDATS